MHFCVCETEETLVPLDYSVWLLFVFVGKNLAQAVTTIPHAYIRYIEI